MFILIGALLYSKQQWYVTHSYINLTKSFLQIRLLIKWPHIRSWTTLSVLYRGQDMYYLWILFMMGKIN